MSGPFRHLSVWRLWKFVGRARDPCRSTVRVSIGTRVIYYFNFCNVYKRAPVMGVPLVLRVPARSAATRERKRVEDGRRLEKVGESEIA